MQLQSAYDATKKCCKLNEILLLFVCCVHATQRAKIVEKVQKPPLEVNVINFELDWFNAFILVP